MNGPTVDYVMRRLRACRVGGAHTSPMQHAHSTELDAQVSLQHVDLLLIEA